MIKADGTVMVGLRNIGKVVGMVFHKPVTQEEHMLRWPEAYCVADEALRDLRTVGVETVEVHEEDTGRTLRVPLSHFSTPSYCFPCERGGWEKQTGVYLRYWRVEDPNQPSLEI